MAPLILLMFVLHPLRHLIKSIIGIAFSLVYYSTDITIYFIEKLMSSINWAGKRGAWIVVSALPILVCTIVGYSIFSSKFCLQALLFHPPRASDTAFEENWLYIALSVPNYMKLKGVSLPLAPPRLWSCWRSFCGRHHRGDNIRVSKSKACPHKARPLKVSGI